MKLSNLIWIICFLAFAGFMGWMYLNYDKPIQESLSNKVNVSIYAVDESSKFVKTGYEIYLDNILYHSGETISKSPILLSIPSDRFVKIKNYNLENQTYYSNSIEFYSNITNNRIKIDLIEPSSVLVDLKNDFSEDEGILEFNLTTERIFKDLIFCLEWTTNFIYMKSNYELMNEKPENYKTYDKCFETKYDLNSTNYLELNISYKIWGNLEDKDFLKIAIIDSENGKSYFNNSDLFSKDKIISINKFGELNIID